MEVGHVSEEEEEMFVFNFSNRNSLSVNYRHSMNRWWQVITGVEL